jgi:hypothetical protein
MTHATENTTVDCAFTEATSHLNDFLDSLGARQPDGAVIPLSVPVADASVVRDIVAKLTDTKTVGRLAIAGITWSAKGGGPYPVFTGTLTLGEASALTSTLTVAGDYAPPGGVVGAAFDAVLGRRMATASLKALLATLKAAIETAHKTTAVTAAQYLPTYE